MAAKLGLTARVGAFILIKKLGILLLLLVALAAGALYWAWQLPLQNNAVVRLEIQAGQSLAVLAPKWQNEGWLPNAWLLRLQARVLGFKSLRQGEFDLPVGLNGEGFLAFLQSATPVAHKITLVEGRPLREALAVISAEPALVQDISPLTLESVAQRLGLEGSAEGWIYPDTYVFFRGEKVSTLLTQAHQRLHKVLMQSWQQRAPNLPYKTPYEALIMASIVEKETAVAQERPQIAGVFVRRLEKNMRLETDPTVIYGLGADFDGNLKRVHLQDGSNPWNTYRHFGLPPSPIALAGKEAIEAALHPASGNELFFVARGDGSHVFSATLEAHNQAVREYQLKRVNNYRSTPQARKDPQ